MQTKLFNLASIKFTNLKGIKVMFSRDLIQISDNFLNNTNKETYTVGNYFHKDTGNRITVKKICGKYIVVDVHGVEAVRRKDELENYNYGGYGVVNRLLQ